MKSSTFVGADGKVIARGVIKPQYIDLRLADGSRIFSTKSDGYTLELLQSLEIKNIIKGAK